MHDGKRVEIRPMTESDIPSGMRLREWAGWNQTEADWRRFLRFEPAGCFVACKDGKVCGTVTTLNYGFRFGWVSMVLVDPDYRRQGIGTRLLEEGIASLERAGVETVKLDATPMGRTVYVQRGFRDEYSIERWEGVAKTAAAPEPGEMSRKDLSLVCEWDRGIFGADRSRLLRSLWEEGSRYSAVALSGGEIAGYVLGRSGSKAHYLGPWIATNRTVAEELMRAFMSRIPGERVFMDVCLEHPDAQGLVRSADFSFQRPLTRMYRGPNNHPGVPRLVCGIAGPELG